MAKTAAPTTTDRDVLVANVQDILGLSSKAAAKRTVDAVLGAIVSEIQTNGQTKDWTLRLHELGSFKVVAVAQKTGRNPQSGEAKVIPARTKVKVTLAKALRDLGK